jgi:D-cysteine desulfhydrase
MIDEPRLPTPLTRCAAFGTDRAEVWLKNDGLSHPVYGGNKVRKAAELIEKARRSGARRVLTVGALGSHHVLTMALFARAAGLRCAAVLFPQPATAHVVDTLRAALGQGLEPYCVTAPALVPLRLLAALRPGDAVIPPGGSTVTGALAYAKAAGELARQFAELGAQSPDLIVAPLGSGATVAGLAVGAVQHGLSARVLGVQVVPGPVPRLAATGLARLALRRIGLAASELGGVLEFDQTQVGAGYGHPTAAGAVATAIAAREGLTLDATYTAKAFAAVLTAVERAERRDRPLRVLYWHTLSAIPLEPLLADAPGEDQLPADVKRLLAAAP